MTRLFISYRRADSATVTGRINDRLIAVFGASNVFKDVDDIHPGEDFRAVLAHEVQGCDVLLAVIGPQWATVTDAEGRHRLKDPEDFVNIEVEAGLTRPEVLVVPVLVEGAQMPRSEDLPENLRPLRYRNAIIIRNDPDFNRDMQRLIDEIREFERRRKTSRSLRRTAVLVTTGVALFALAAFVLLRGVDSAPNAQQDPVVTLTATAQHSTGDALVIAQPIILAAQTTSLRSAPSAANSQVVGEIAEDRELLMLAGPVQGPLHESGQLQGRWFHVQDRNDATLEGWVPADMLVLTTGRVQVSEIAAPAFVRTLFETDPWQMGDDVRLLQSRLTSLGYDPGPIDGEFGPVTASAVRAFQRRNNLAVDGIAGINTWTGLFSAEAVSAD